MLQKGGAKMPTVKDKVSGDVVSRQPYNEEGINRASTIADSNPSWELEYNYPASNAMDRKTTTPMGDNFEYGEPIAPDVEIPDLGLDEMEAPVEEGMGYEGGGIIRKYVNGGEIPESVIESMAQESGRQGMPTKYSVTDEMIEFLENSTLSQIVNYVKHYGPGTDLHGPMADEKADSVAKEWLKFNNLLEDAMSRPDSSEHFEKLRNYYLNVK